jgi:hypothetical protein
MPQPEKTSFSYFHSVYDLSCRNAQFQNSDTGIINHVWNEFIDQVILNQNGDSLIYYKTWNTTYTSLSSLLRYRTAQCYTFAQLFLAALKIQGVARTSNYVNISAGGTSACGYSVNRMLVKNWQFGNPSAASQCTAFPYKATYGSLLNGSSTGYNFLTADITDMTGSKGSCNPNPPSLFNNHQLAKIDGVYYDPSYGVKYSSLAQAKVVALDGWGMIYSGSGVTNALFTDDVSKANFMESISTY